MRWVTILGVCGGSSMIKRHLRCLELMRTAYKYKEYELFISELINEPELSEMQDVRYEMLMDEVSLRSTIRRCRAKRCYRHVTYTSKFS